MIIWIMRHGEASFNAPSDEKRPLTPIGEASAVAQGEWLGQRLQSEQLRLDKILVSPYLRAQQTLEKLISGMQAVDFSQNFANLVETWEKITPDGNPHTVEDYLAFLHEEGAKQVLIVSHLPLVFDLAQRLTQRSGNVQFPTATIAEINWNGKTGKIAQVKFA